MSGSDLRDRLHREMLASNRAWYPEEIARSALRIVSDAARADGLVSAILGGDERFCRDGLAWRACAPRPPALRTHAFLLADLPPVRWPAGTRPLFLQPYEVRQAGMQDPLRILPDCPGLDRAGAWLGERLVASLAASPVRRQMHLLERLHALPAASERVLDLAAALHHLGEPMPHAFAREASASVEERLEACRTALERVLDAFGARPLDDLEREIDETSHGTPVDFSAFRFGQELLGLIPARPGLYRFWGEEGKLLYVGKSRDLRRRVGSYFRPLGEDHQRRARLLSEIRDLEWETTPSELEALILEAEAIRQTRPPHNQQLVLHPGGEKLAALDRDLAFVLCEGDPDEVSVFLLRERAPWARARLARAPAQAVLAAASRIVGAWTSGTLETSAELVPVASAEGLLVLRFLRLHGERIDQVRREDFPDVGALAEALARLALRPRPAWDPWVMRAPADPQE